MEKKSHNHLGSVSSSTEAAVGRQDQQSHLFLQLVRGSDQQRPGLNNSLLKKTQLTVKEIVSVNNFDLGNKEHCFGL